MEALILREFYNEQIISVGTSIPSSIILLYSHYFNQMNSDIIFEKLSQGLPEKLQQNLKVKLRFKVKMGNEVKSWLIDIPKNRVVLDDTEEVDTVFHINDDDMVVFARGQMNLRILFMRNRLYIEGDYANAIRFTPDYLPKLPLL